MFVLAVAMIAALAVPAFAQNDGNSDGPRVVITGRVAVGARERTDSVVIFDGPAVIDGDVHSSVVAFHGDVLVRGHVDSNVVAVRGRAAIASSATVGGDVVSSERPLVAPGRGSTVTSAERTSATTSTRWVGRCGSDGGWP